VSEDSLDETIRFLQRLAADRRLLADFSDERRQALLEAAGRLANPAHDEKRRLAKAFRRRDRLRVRHHDARLVDATRLRNLRQSPVFLPPSPHVTEPDVEGELIEPRTCYVCKEEFKRLHFFYESLCPTCAQLNWEKRSQTADLRGRVALVTGARVKIGYHIGLILLRAGARVVATTRFPHDAAARYAKEPDFESFRDRLDVYGLDLRHAPSVELFAEHLGRSLPRLDFLINNAAQTVRRPSPYYAPLLPGERAPLPPQLASVCARHDALLGELGQLTDTETPALVRWSAVTPAAGLSSSAQLSQLPLTPEDTHDAHFPEGALDPDLQQIDLRPQNSWRLGAADVSTPELLEVHLVNAIAPFLLTARLRGLMAKDPPGDRHVVNVSAMEAQFSRHKKTDKHPHTNMAKAALNMLTRTSAVDWAKDKIWMNSVDTGWITDEDPMQHVTRKQRVHDFFPPLDIVDGAARVLDPIFVGLKTGEHPWGVFFKDYRSVRW
jgi:NAD(P)-dependent dehydrogenase (short-subunit alcohol dehydrogenase family)